MNPILYRKRLIPMECVHLKDDILLYRDSNILITKWKTLHPKKTLDHGLSCYFLNDGIKVSKFYNNRHELISWYCDIVTYEYQKENDTYIFTDLLADVVVSPEGNVTVLDLDELADAQEKELISKDQLLKSLRQLNNLLQIIYDGKFSTLQHYINEKE